MQALVLCGFSVANYALLYVTSILLARTLSVADFDDYNVAVSSVLVLTSLATLGLEKYALRCLPAWHNHQDWSRSSGFLQFSRRLILVTSLVLVVLFCVTLELTLTLRGKPYHVAIVILAMFLPATAMFQLILEVAAAYGGAIEGGRLLPDLVSGAVAPAQCRRLGFARGKRGVSATFAMALPGSSPLPCCTSQLKATFPLRSGKQSRCGSLAYGYAVRFPWLPAAWCSPCLLRPA